MAGGQRIQADLARARKTAAVTVRPGTIQVAAGTSITVTAARAASRDSRRHKAPDYGWRPPSGRARHREVSCGVSPCRQIL